MENKPRKQWQQNLKGAATVLGENFKRKKITHLHKLLRNRGMGFYGIGYVCTLLYLEATSFLEEISEFRFSLDNVVGQIISHVINFSIETVINVVKASIWPFILMGKLPNEYALSILVVFFVVYYVADKKWNFQQMYNNKFSEESAQPVIELWQQQQTGNLADLQHLQLSKIDSSKELLELFTEAKQNKLESWRLHPQSNFALVILLNAEFQDKPGESTNLASNYCLEVIKNNIADELDKELNLEQRCYLYRSLAFDDNPKNQKLASKQYIKLGKKLSKTKQQQLKNLLNSN